MDSNILHSSCTATSFLSDGLVNTRKHNRALFTSGEALFLNEQRELYLFDGPLAIQFIYL